LLTLLSISLSFGQTTKIKEYLSVPGPITLGNVTYNLVWTSHPTDEYYKQEYIPKGDNVEKFKKMVMVEVLTGNTTAKELATRKMKELKEMKASNPIINYESFEKDGEILLDFLISENAPDGKRINILERNVYRYKTIVTHKGQKCLLLLAASERAYGSDATKFLQGLKARKSELVNQVAAYTMPVVVVGK
jgi:hypothetical protein